ncbi:transglycosylase domain-containing protein [Tessaracoccus oleiagri]|uniref:Membrane carboxypeptidase (Penicillin-binding protein) n=1 Tax=Tessaracoccus oleiagri TaxID=686624 RepID=A0A1G9I1Z3_9ACTN|nr:transglycosylase domain-containing protein [Tessaracoccus oleiagri]SDL19102.1 Membrane carboxypeptidase (penicillin-binding protein) [Tessaracoccus oleiagri]
MAEAKRSKARRGKNKGVGKRIALVAAILVLVLGLMGVGSFIYLYATTDVPDPNEDFQTNTTFIHYAGGEQLGSLAVQNRQTIPYDQMPQVMKDAVVAAENRTFWTDPGFSVRGMARAAWSIASGGEMQGGSTITQQYIKVLYLDPSQTIQRKVRELMLAIKLEQEVPKEEILEGYLNTIYFGRGAYGIQAAAKSFFLKDAKDLTVSEAAALAAILNNPAAFNPSGGQEKLDALYGRYKYVLDGMLEMGTITQEEYAAAYPQLPEFPEVPVNNRYGGPKGYLIKMVEDELETLGIPQEQVQGGGLKVTTTIDKRLQDRAVEVAQGYTQEAAENGEEGATAENLHVALASVDTANGAIRALYGGPDYVEKPRNWATTPRAAASTFKTFAVIAGLREGFDLNTRLNGDTFTPEGDPNPIRNQGREQYGSVTLREALAQSINTAMVDLTQQLEGGPQAILQAAFDAGVPEDPEAWQQQLNNRIALGFGEVSPLDMANSYATLANSGQRNETFIVAKVEDPQGNVVYEAEPAAEPTIEQDIAAATTDALTSVVDEGTGRRAQTLDRPVAGKTGTNAGTEEDSITSAWFAGYTKQLSTAVMYVAGEGGTDNLVPYRQPGDRTFYGSGYPLSTWLDFMTTAMEGVPVEDFDTPPTPEPSEEPTSESPSPTPSEEPTSESPSPSPSPTPSEEPSPTPSEEPTSEEPTEEPSPLPEPTTLAPPGNPSPPGQQPTEEPTSSDTTTPTEESTEGGLLDGFVPPGRDKP